MDGFMFTLLCGAAGMALVLVFLQTKGEKIFTSLMSIPYFDLEDARWLLWNGILLATMWMFFVMVLTFIIMALCSEAGMPIW